MMTRLIRRKIWPLIAPATESTAKRVVIMGFPRSGTSVTGNLVGEMGYQFGTERDVRRGDTENPHGYYEHAKFNRLTETFYWEAGLYIGAPLKEHETLRSKGLLGKSRRFFTRLAMRQLIVNLDRHASHWAVKIFPHLFYVWAEHFKNAKLVCVYRDPREAAHSYLNKWPNSQTFANIIKYWTAYNRDMLYHMTTHESFLIRYEDLFDNQKLATISRALQTFLGTEQSPDLTKIVDSSRNRAGVYTNRFSQTYPLDQETKDILEALNANCSYERNQ